MEAVVDQRPVYLLFALLAVGTALTRVAGPSHRELRLRGAGRNRCGDVRDCAGCFLLAFQGRGDPVTAVAQGSPDRFPALASWQSQLVRSVLVGMKRSRLVKNEADASATLPSG